MEKVIKTVCALNCPVRCGLKVYVRKNKVIKIEGDLENPINKGKICSRMLYYPRIVHSKERILYPLRRRGKRGKGEFVPISWEEASDIILNEMVSLKERFGVESVLYFSGSGTKGIYNDSYKVFFYQYGGFSLTYGDLCWISGIEATKLTLGKVIQNDPFDLLNSKLIIIWGKNPANSNFKEIELIIRAKSEGAKIIVIDPLRTDTSKFADIHLRINPGTDGLLALAISQYLIKKKLVKTNFIEDNVLGYDEYRNFLKNYSIKYVSEITGIKEDKIEGIANLIGKSKRVSIICGYGLTKYSNSFQTIRAMIGILALTGNIGKRGSGWYFANFEDNLPKLNLPPKPENIFKRISLSNFGEDILNLQSPPIKLLWIERANPIITLPNSYKVLEAFQNIETIVVVDSFITETAKWADIILPAKTFLEEYDLVSSYWHKYIQLQQKVIDPPGLVKTERELWKFLCKKMGYNDKYLPDKSDKGIRNLLTNIKGLSFEKLQKKPVLIPGSKLIAFSDSNFSTPSGKIELYSKTAKIKYNLPPLPFYKLPKETKSNIDENSEFSFHFITSHSKFMLNTQFKELTKYFINRSEPMIFINPSDAKKLNIKDYQLLEVFNERGSLKIKVKISDLVPEGILHCYFGWSIKNGLSPNLLTGNIDTDIKIGTALNESLVNIKIVK